MHPNLRDYFYFNRSQRRGLILLVFLILLSIAFKQYMPYFIKPQSAQSHPELNRLIAELERESGDNNSFSENKESIENEKAELFDFDPNEIDLESWVKLGLSEKQAKVILNYREKGGVFRSKEDLAKMYTVTEEFYNRIKDHIQIKEKPTVKNEKYSSTDNKLEYKKKVPIILDINTADSADFLQLYGIGPTYASRIVKYRKALGGFKSIDQLKEVWGLKDSTVEKFKNQLILSDFQLHQIKVNYCQINDLSAHPYIDWNTAKAIVNYRKQHGTFAKPEDLLKVYLVQDSLKEKISPYLDFTLDK